jgi:hypothetical protein
MLGTWINVARSVFNATKIWVSDDPAYVEIRELMKADFQQNLVKPLRTLITDKYYISQSKSCSGSRSGSS